jgi:hypothetical protein
MNLDGFFRPIPANAGGPGVPPNAEWTNPETPPDKVGFTAGQQWVANQLGYVPGYAADPYSAAELGLAGVSDPFSGINGPFTLNSITINDTDPTVYDCEGSGFTGGGSPQTFTFNVSSSACTAGSSAACPLENKETQWPSDGEINLIFKNGKFQTSQYDPDATAQYSGQESSHINFCMEGGRKGTLRTTKDGGVALYETDTANGAPTAGKDILLYNSNGVPTQSIASDKLQHALVEGDTV